jgi:diguanylate cyclase (GGDEF)-like protein
VTAVVAAVAAGFVVPWERLFLAGWGDHAMFAWSAADIILVTVGAAATGGPRSEIVFLYALTTLFFAASYPGVGQVGLFALTCGSYFCLVELWGSPTPAAIVVTRLAVAAIVWFMAAFLARERTAEMDLHLQARALAEHRAELLSELAATGAAIATLDPEELMSGVVDSLVRIGFEFANFCVLDHDPSTYRVAHARGLPDEYMGTTHSSATGTVALVLERQAAVVVPDYRNYPRALPILVKVNARTVVGAPVWVDGRIHAVLVAATTRVAELASSDVEVFELLAGQVSRALDNARRFQKERDVAQEASAASLTDELTGVGNRRHGNRLLDRLRPGQAVVVIDLDHFKGVNDVHGHPVGDEVLRELAAHLRSSLRDGDDVARYGGEEFLVVLHDTSTEALDVINRLLTGWRARQPLATFSAGIALHRADQPIAITIAQADAALYAAKRLGRDRACEYGAGLTEESSTHPIDLDAGT